MATNHPFSRRIAAAGGIAALTVAGATGVSHAQTTGGSLELAVDLGLNLELAVGSGDEGSLEAGSLDPDSLGAGSAAPGGSLPSGSLDNFEGSL